VGRAIAIPLAKRVQARRTAVGVRSGVGWALPVPARNPHIRQTDLQAAGRVQSPRSRSG